MVAHIAHRIPLFRWIGKRSEGKDKKAGIASDFLTLIAQIGAKNENLIREGLGDAVGDAIRNRGSSVIDVTPVDQTHKDFGLSDPLDVQPKQEVKE
jgi:hypothetical protein